MPSHFGPAAIFTEAYLSLTSLVAVQISPLIGIIGNVGTAIKFPPVFFQLLPVIISLGTTLWVSFDKSNDALVPNPRQFSTYDYIIIGGGTTGSVIANRLSKDSSNKVLVLEAGGIPTLFNTVPSLALLQLGLPDITWNYTSVPQKYCCKGLIDNRLPYPCGKLIGGSSNLNLMVWVRGNPKDYDNWANLTGNDQWNYENLLPYFKRSENYEGYFPSDKFHGKGGPITISKQESIPSLKLWLEAAKENGFIVGDSNAYQTEEFFPADVDIQYGHRQGTYWTYMQSIQNRCNLYVQKFAFVEKIIIDEKTKRATGVKYVRNGETVIANAAKEIILSAGTINSPKILMLSGIGPREHLDSLGIPILVDLQVGSNLHDHPGIALPFIFNKSVSTFMLQRDLNAGTLVSGLFGQGPIATNFGHGLAFYSTSTAEKDWPDIEFYLLDIGLSPPVDKYFETFLRGKPNLLVDYMKPGIGNESNIILIHLGRPYSRGTVRLSSKNPYDSPLVDPNIFADSRDVDRLIEAMEYIIKFFENTTVYQSYGATLFPHPLPGCEDIEFRSVDYLRCHLEQITMTIYHQAGTCKMGNSSDPTAVVDPNLRVFNVTGLRVADASIMPQLTNGNTQAPCIAIGEKAAELILNDNRS